MACLHLLSHACARYTAHVFASNSHLSVLRVFVTGQIDNFGFGFATLDQNLL